MGCHNGRCGSGSDWYHKMSLCLLQMAETINQWSQDEALLCQLVSMINDNAGSREFNQSFKELIWIHDSAILVLISGAQADRVCAALGFDGIVRSEAVGFRGGIWVLWHHSRVWIDQIDMHVQVVTLQVSRTGEAKWLLSSIYASPRLENRDELWSRLIDFDRLNQCLWLLIWDFNETRLLSERIGNSDEMHRRCTRFSRWIDKMCLLELGYNGQRLDRGLCNVEWHNMFADGTIRHLSTSQSDHTPLLLSLKGFDSFRPGPKLFRFSGDLVIAS
ncbi:hypothetical protein V2J09_000511 [Rumex salicifolius]